MNLDQIDIRDAFFDQLYLKGSIDNNVIVLSADMDAFSLRRFAKDLPEQYINVGVSEQNMINIASGLALSGKMVFCYSIASFATLRCFEQIKVNICSMNLPVTIIGAGAGFSFGYDGPTHHGHQDLSSMRLLPEMSIIELSSNDLAQKAVNFAFENNGPLYIRLDKGPFPEWKEYNIDFSKGYRIIQPLSKLNIVTNGYMTRTALKVADTLIAEGIDCGVVDLFRVKPFPEEFYEEVISPSKKIVSIEESCKTGGLGSALSELIAQNDNNCRLHVIGAPDKQFIEYGEREWFHEKYLLDAKGIIESIVS